MSVQIRTNTPPQSISEKSLTPLQKHLVEAKSTVGFFRELLGECKGLLFDLALIAFFVWEMVKLFKNLHG